VNETVQMLKSSVDALLKEFSFRGGLSVWKPQFESFEYEDHVRVALSVEVPMVGSDAVSTWFQLKDWKQYALRNIESLVQVLVQHEISESVCFGGQPLREPHPKEKVAT
jgi:hypothetical protein